MLTWYFSRSDGALATDAMFGFLVGLAVVLAVSSGGLGLPEARALVRLAAGTMLVATFVGGVALGRSVDRALW